MNSNKKKPVKPIEKSSPIAFQLNLYDLLIDQQPKKKRKEKRPEARDSSVAFDSTPRTTEPSKRMDAFIHSL